MATIPTQHDFPAGTAFVIKEFDVPLARVPRAGACEWVNWFGGAPRPCPAASLTVDNNWPASSFEEWAALVKASIPT